MSILFKKFLPPFLGFATLTWIVGGTYWFKNQFCNESIDTNTAVAVNNSGTHLPFYFSVGASQPIFLSESFLQFKETSDYLNDNRDKTLVINGLFASEEAQNPRLGLERAEAIKSVLLNLGTLSSSLVTKCAQRKNLFFVNQQLFDGVEFKVVDNLDGHFQALNLFFQKNKFQFLLNDDLKEYFHKLNDYMSFHPHLKLKITAHQDNTEGGQLSKKRLAFMRNFLIHYDFSAQQFDFEDKKSHKPLSEEEKIKNRRVEIRLIVP